MRTARRNSWEQGIRINYVAPCWIKSAIRTAEYEQWLVNRGIQFGETEDCAGCMMRISCDKTVNGEFDPGNYDMSHSKQLMKFTGHSLMIVPRSEAKEGFKDVDRDDYRDTEEDAYMKRTQISQLATIEDKWLDDFKVRVYKA
jgi:hypothetical protein